MADIKDRISKGLSEIRTVVLGAQILFGFQYQAVFQAGFSRLASWAQQLELIAFAAMLVVIILVVTPTPFHRLSERGDATVRQSRLISLVMMTTLAIFAVAIGANTAVATSISLPPIWAGATGTGATAVALFFWFGLELMHQRPAKEDRLQQDVRLPVKEKISQLLTEARLVLPGVQALLGFQFAAFLTDAFRKLDPVTQGVHTASLLLLLAAMVLLMSPAPFHRLAECGEDTPRAESFAQTMILIALVPMALGLGGDFYVALKIVTGSTLLAAGGAAAPALVAGALWFVLPLAIGKTANGRSHGRDGRPRQ